MTTTHPWYRDRDGYVWEDREGFPMLVTPNGPAPTDYVTMQGVRHAYGPLVRVEQAEPAPRADPVWQKRPPPCPHQPTHRTSPAGRGRGLGTPSM